MYKLILLFGFVAIVCAEDESVTAPTPTSTALFNQDYFNRNQRYQNPTSPFNTYPGNKLYKPYNRPNYFDKDYQKPNYFDKDYQKPNFFDKDYQKPNFFDKDYQKPNYFDKDYQKSKPIDYYNKDYSNKNYEYNQKFIQDGKNAGILRSVNEVHPDGSYQYGFDTQNGIAVEQQGVVKALSAEESPVVVQGFYRYISPEGLPVEVKYTADESGYHPQGSVISGQRQPVAYKSAGSTVADEK